MILKDFLSVLNARVRYKVTDRITKESIEVLTKDKETLKRKIYLVFQDNDGTLNITLY